MKLKPASIKVLLLAIVLVSCSRFTSGTNDGQGVSTEDVTGPGGAANLTIESCTSYAQKFVACVSEKVPEETKVMLLAALEQSKVQWKQALSSGMAPDVVSQSCLAALETAKQTMAQYSCSW